MGKRRDLLKAGAAGVGLVAFAVGYRETAEQAVQGTVEALSRPARARNINGRSLAPEFTVDPLTGSVTPNPDQYVANTMCLGCTTICGVRVRVERSSGRVLRVAGNPYHPLSAEPHLPYATPIRDSFSALSRYHESGLAQRATACGRGAAVLEQMTSPHRVLTPLKRVGPRNGGHWQPIALEQLISEVVEGGDLFGEGHVEGLRAVRSFDAIDPARPDLGPKANQLGMMLSVEEGRVGFARRFMQQAFGSINMVGHGAYCGGSYRAGSGAVFGDTKLMPHARPDISDAEFVIFCGTAPGNAGNPFKRMGWEVAAGRDTGRLDYVVIDPVLGNSDNIAGGQHARWVPIRPATDGAFALAMIRWILDNGAYAAGYLSRPNAAAAKAAGEGGYSNATHLVIVEPGHPREAAFLRGSDLGWATGGSRYGDQDPFVVIDSATGTLRSAAEAPEGALFVDTVLPVGETSLRLRSSLDLLRASSRARTIEGYSAICGIPVRTIEALAHAFTSHGRKASIAVHGGTMAGNGFNSAFALLTLNTLIGNLNWKGGTAANAPPFPAEGGGPRYDLAHFEGQLEPRGTPLSRNVVYEKSAEFQARKQAGKPYPAARPWYPTAGQLASEYLPAALDGEPYPLKALLLWSVNPLYGVPGLRQAVESGLSDPRKLPLIVAIDPFINETSAFADYVVPDSLLYESWGWATPWGSVPTRTSTARWPAVEPAAQKDAAGEPAGMESFLIGCARQLGLPGFGPNAIKDARGQSHPLDRASDWYLRGGANIAFAADPVPDAEDDDLALSGVERLRPVLQSTLAPDEWRKVGYVLARGGRFDDAQAGFKGEKAARPVPGMMHIYNEVVGTSRNALTGRRVAGVPEWLAASFADGTPMRSVYSEKDWPFLVVSQKSPLMNSYGIGVNRLRNVVPSNPVGVNGADAQRLGIVTGDRIRIETPGGHVLATAMVRGGVMQGVLAIPHGYGHRELGARAHRIGDAVVPATPGTDAGVNHNALGLADPTRQGRSVWVDPIAGTAVRQGLPARVVVSRDRSGA